METNAIKIEDSNSETDNQNIDLDGHDLEMTDSDTKSFFGFPNVAEFSKNGLKQIVETTKCINALPSGASRDLYSAHTSFQKIIRTHSDRILEIISGVIKSQNIKGNIQRRDDDEKFELLQECNDIMLERVNSHIDILAGIRKAPETIQQLVETTIQPNTAKPLSGSWNERRFQSPLRSAKLITAKNIQRPQTNFKIPVDNSNANPFEPKIKYKPNSIKPLAILPEYGEDGNIESYLHPYEFELNKFKPDPAQLIKVEPKKYLLIESTPLILVDSEIKLKKMIDELKFFKEIAVDLEHHSYRTFLGITCLMQISTREKDYIVDTLILREELHVLNEIFTDPSVVKVFHGADSDIIWLQRDFSIYVVNLFDTHQAAKIIGLARLSLAYLLKHYCNIDLDKSFQLADWRIRPIPDELIVYARKDTHYLLYIYDLMKNNLIKSNNGQIKTLSMSIQLSTEICKIRYIKPHLYPDSHMEVYRKSKKNFDNRQLYALKEIFGWRDKIARIEDESFGYVLPNHMMLQICESLPREMQGILACCNPIPPLVRQNLNLLHQIILKAREQPLVMLITEEQIQSSRVTGSVKDINSALNCPHDLSHNTEFRDDLPTLLGNISSETTNKAIRLAKPALSVFHTPENSDDETSKMVVAKLRKIKFVSPYERYKLVLPFAEQQRLNAARKEQEFESSKILCPKKIDAPKIILKEQEKKEEVSLHEMNKKRKKEEAEDERKNDTVKKQKIKEELQSNEIDINSNEESSNLDNTIDTSIPADRIKKTRKPKYISKNDTRQNSSKPIDFDYASVDYKKFQGGSQTQNPWNQNKINLKNQGQHSKGEKKQFNKLFAFSNVNKRGGKK